jgi:hypothetical protein
MVWVAMIITACVSVGAIAYYIFAVMGIAIDLDQAAYGGVRISTISGQF